MGTLLNLVDHVAVNVTDMEKSLKFYHEVLGLKIIFQTERSGSDLDRALNAPGAKLRYSYLQADNTCIGLIQYVNPAGKSYDRKTCDTGIMHLAFRVPDIEKAYAQLKEKGVRFNSSPVKIESGPQKGSVFAFFTDPDGITLEIFQE